MYVDDERWRVAYHEAGHAIAAALCGVQWTEARANPNPDNTFRTAGLYPDHYTPEDIGRASLAGWVEGETIEEAASEAFVAWAGQYAETRSGYAESLARTEAGAESDWGKVWTYWNDPAHTPHQTEDDWEAALDAAWPHVEAMARELAVHGIARVPTSE